jgi:hypothetical protein
MRNVLHGIKEFVIMINLGLFILSSKEISEVDDDWLQ